MHFGTKSYLKSNRYHTAKHLAIDSVQVNFNSLAHCSNTRAPRVLLSPAWSLAWASDRVGLAESSPTPKK
jgi:hypothetical protein